MASGSSSRASRSAPSRRWRAEREGTAGGDPAPARRCPGVHAGGALGVGAWPTLMASSRVAQRARAVTGARASVPPPCRSVDRRAGLVARHGISPIRRFRRFPALTSTADRVARKAATLHHVQEMPGGNRRYRRAVAVDIGVKRLRAAIRRDDPRPGTSILALCSDVAAVAGMRRWARDGCAVARSLRGPCRGMRHPDLRRPRYGLLRR